MKKKVAKETERGDAIINNLPKNKIKTKKKRQLF